VITDPVVIRLLAEGGAIEVFGSKGPDSEWSFIGTATTLDDDLEPVHAGGVSRTTDLTKILPPQWVVFTPTLIHPDLREWFRSRYDAAVAALPEWRRESHTQFRHGKWRALFESTPPDRWSQGDAF
jgi:hypothetical protein